MPRGIISTHESGEDLILEWRIQDFSTLQEHDGAQYWSPEFSFGGERWFLVIFPNSRNKSGACGDVDLWLHKYLSGRSIRVTLSFSLKTVKGERYREEHVTKDFHDLHSHKFNPFMSRAELTRRRSDLLPDDVLTVVCTMKGSTSTGRKNNDTGHANVRASSQRLRASIQSVRASTQTVEASTQIVEEKLDLLEATSEIDKLKLNYDQALQDKVEAEKKLGFFTNLFKEKETHLQMQLSAKEDEVKSAKKRIMLIEQENASYKSQVARLKQEMEEKERTLRKQIAACNAERNMEKMEQEITQLRQRLRLLKIEQEKWTNAATDEIIRSVPKTCVEACTQTVEGRLGHEPELAYMEAWTQTLEEEFTFNNESEDCHFVTDINNLLRENKSVDATFELETPIGKITLFAHKLILAVMFSYFADEFYNKKRNDGHRVIPLKRVSPKAFEQMIRYCYGEKPILRTTEDACALFKVASDFKVISLQNFCHTFFRHTKIEPGNVFTVLKISVEMEDKNLQSMCYKILQEETREVLAAYELYDVTPAMVYTLLNLPKLSLNSEYELMKWIFDWAKLKAEDKYSSSKNAREYLESLLKYMKFLALTMEEFAILCKDNPGFFNSDEIACICLNLACPGTREMPDWYDKDMQCHVYTGSNE